MIEEVARAKVNLTLRICGKLSGGAYPGYHAVESLVVFPAIADRLLVEPSDDLTLEISGEGAQDLADLPVSSNLVMKAAELLKAKCGISSGARLRLEKNLPMEAGIGGGSADAAATLRALMALWQPAIDGKALLSLALALGADVPVALVSRPSLMSGIGERVEALGPLPALWVLLVNCGAKVSTPQVFKALAAEEIKEPPEVSVPSLETADDLIAYIRAEGNDMQAPAQKLVPEIAGTLSALKELDGVLISGMSGSGATCYGLFASIKEAEAAAGELKKNHPKWWIRSGPLLDQ